MGRLSKGTIGLQVTRIHDLQPLRQYPHDTSDSLRVWDISNEFYFHFKVICRRPPALSPPILPLGALKL